jgi:hypothetical protein
MTNYKKISGFLAGLVLLLMVGCYKNSTVIPEGGDEVTRTVSFSNDIVPIFNSSCNISGCHNSGGKTHRTCRLRMHTCR